MAANEKNKYELNSSRSKANVESGKKKKLSQLFVHAKKLRVTIIKMCSCDTLVGVVPGGRVNSTLTLMWSLIPDILEILGLTYFQKELKPERFPGKVSG